MGATYRRSCIDLDCTVTTAVSLIIAGLGLSGTAFAQSAGQPVPNAQSSAQSDALQEIVVTAEHRSEDLQKTPVAVSVLQGSQLQSEGRFSVSQILEDVPSVTWSPATGTAVNSDVVAPNITIRGVSSNGAVQGSITSVVPAIAYYVDDVVNGIGGTYDINRVEVLRGPQGTLYGRSATGGVVDVHTASPLLDRFEGNAAIEFGDYGLQHYTGAVNVPVGDSFALRVSGNSYSRDGYYSPQGNKVDTTDGRIKLLFKPNDALSALIGVAFQDNRESSGQNQGVLGRDGAVSFDTIVPLGTGYDQTQQYWARIDWDLGPATLTYIPALRRWDQHSLNYGAPVPGLLAIGDQRTPYDQAHTEELRLASNPDSTIKWQTGAFYYGNSLDNSYDLLLQPIGLVLQQAATSRLTENVGLYAEATYPFSAATRLTTGARYDRTKVRTAETDCSGVTIAPLNCLTVTPQDGTRLWNNFTYKVRLEHDLSAANLLYASVSSAFLPGDVSVVNAPPTGALVEAPYEPETLTSLELGSKNRFLDDHLQINGDLFYYRYGAQQQSVQTGTFLGAGLFQISASPARMFGAEIEALFKPTLADQLGLSASYVDGYYVDKPDIFQNGVIQNHLPAVIPITVEPAYSHTFSLPSNETLVFRGEAIYHSAYDVSPVPLQYASLAQYVRVGSKVTGNFYLAWNYASWGSISGYVRNVADIRYMTTLYTWGPSATAIGAATQSDPRTFGAVLSVTF
jgi:iron complex outermembrane receptor protein